MITQGAFGLKRAECESVDRSVVSHPRCLCECVCASELHVT